ncbi:MAG: ATP-binding protein [Streptosporangiaceae bacterium]
MSGIKSSAVSAAMNSAAQALSRVVLPGELISARHARRWLREQLGDLDEAVVDDTVLLSNELVVNALRYTDGEVVFGAGRNGNLVRVEVADNGSASSPEIGAYDPTCTSEGGRGLQILDELATRWGVTFLPNGGRNVWFELEPPAGR